MRWVNVLGSLSAYHMYRRKLQAQVEREHVLWFLFKDDEFPRSFMHCLNAVEESLGNLDGNRPCLLAVRKVVRELDQVPVASLESDTLGAFIDSLQRSLMDVHDNVARMYFLPTTPE